MKAKLSNAISAIFPIGKKDYEWSDIFLFFSFLAASVYLLVVVDSAFYNYLTS